MRRLYVVVFAGIPAPVSGPYGKEHTHTHTQEEEGLISCVWVLGQCTRSAPVPHPRERPGRDKDGPDTQSFPQMCNKRLSPGPYLSVAHSPEEALSVLTGPRLGTAENSCFSLSSLCEPIPCRRVNRQPTKHPTTMRRHDDTTATPTDCARAPLAEHSG